MNKKPAQPEQDLKKIFSFSVSAPALAHALETVRRSLSLDMARETLAHVLLRASEDKKSVLVVAADGFVLACVRLPIEWKYGSNGPDILIPENKNPRESRLPKMVTFLREALSDDTLSGELTVTCSRLVIPGAGRGANYLTASFVHTQDSLPTQVPQFTFQFTAKEYPKFEAVADPTEKYTESMEIEHLALIRAIKSVTEFNKGSGDRPIIRMSLTKDGVLFAFQRDDPHTEMMIGYKAGSAKVKIPIKIAVDNFLLQRAVESFNTPSITMKWENPASPIRLEDGNGGVIILMPMYLADDASKDIKRPDGSPVVTQAK
ncbi:MAG: hypothetical protein PHN75_09355 [Syntrophales bacterium]|nr:hypothetical protein [Syntrophales bacterium]